MDFAFSEEQEAFREVLRRFGEERWSLAEVRRLLDTPEGYDRSVWKQMAEELGLQGLIVPETFGGQGFGFLELGIALEELGRQLAGGPHKSLPKQRRQCLARRRVHSQAIQVAKVAPQGFAIVCAHVDDGARSHAEGTQSMTPEAETRRCS